MAAEQAIVASAGGGGRIVRALCGALLTTWGLLQALQGRTDAMVVNGTEMTMDQAIMAAARSPTMFRLMEDANVVRVEMDMLFKTDVWESMMRARESTQRRHRRKALRHQLLRWSNAVIPYQVAVSWSEKEYQQFQEALNDYHRYTCVRFRQATSTDSDYLRIVDGAGCSSYVGRQGGPQTVSLASGCRHKGIIIHELGHAVGFQHEQTRPDRDNHVSVIEENIDSYMLFNFEKYTTNEVDIAGVPYDYLSVMHYGEYAFSRNGQRTIRTLDQAYQNRIGNRGGFSFRDIKLVNAIYGCAARNRCPEKRCPGEGFVGPDCACWCPSGDDSGPVTQCSGQAATTARPLTASACADVKSECSQWALQGHCSRNRNYMSVNCKASCNLCSDRPETTAATTARPATAAPCADDNYACPQWARLGYCSGGQYRQYMSMHCNASCSACPDQPASTARPATSPPCADENRACERWAQAGHCTSDQHRQYMAIHCKASCSLCSVTTRVTKVPVTQLRTVARQTQPATFLPQQTTKVPPPLSTTSGRPSTAYGATTARWHPCHDANDMCRAWADRGECDANPRYMFAHCPESCHSCESGTMASACDDVDVHCDRWRELGHCGSRLYAAYMQQHCPRTCGVCSAAGSVAASTVRREPKTIAATAPTRTPTTTPQPGHAGVATTRSTIGQILKKIVVSLAGTIVGSATDAEGRHREAGGESGRVFIRVLSGGGREQEDDGGQRRGHERWVQQQQQQVDDLARVMRQQAAQFQQLALEHSHAASHRDDSSQSHERRDERRRKGQEHADHARRGDKRGRG